MRAQHTIARLVSIVVILGATAGLARGSAFIYHGRLVESGRPMNGSFDIHFALYDSPTNGSLIAPALTAFALPVTNGAFVASLDFGDEIAAGKDCWLEMGVRPHTGRADSFTGLSPRQLIAPSFQGAEGKAKAASHTAVPGTNAPNQMERQDTNVAPNIVQGDALNAASPGTSGVTISGGGAAAYSGGPQPNIVRASFATIGGGLGNTVESNAPSSTISGGERNIIHAFANSSTISGGFKNSIQSELSYSTIAGGIANLIATNASDSSIGGGSANLIEANAAYSTIGGGSENDIQGNAQYSVISGGDVNVIQPDAHHSVISGGEQNRIQSGSSYATIGGGAQNQIRTNAAGAAIGGGLQNVIQTAAAHSVIGGGNQNRIEPFAYRSTIAGGVNNTVELAAVASVISGGEKNDVGPHADYSMIPGGLENKASARLSFAAGYRAQAANAGSFVWSDASGTPTSSSADNSVTIRATGGYRLLTATNQAGVSLAPGGGSWTSLSDRNAKEHFADVDGREILERLASMRVATWNYTAQESKVRHMGPTAQDFKAAFGLGESDTGITSIDADGVAMAAIQGLNSILAEREHELEEMRKFNRELEQRVRKLEERLEGVAKGRGTGQDVKIDEP